MPNETDQAPKEGIGLCLSGGGYRAMLFHVGALLRLYELGVLTEVDHISSVSGGSITSALMALRWEDLLAARDASPAAKREIFEGAVVQPISHMANQSIDAKSIVSGLALFGTIGERIADAYAEHLFGEATLLSLPTTPRFIINATNVQTGALWRFSGEFMGDWRLGRVLKREHLSTVRLADAVAASSAFPPVLSPFKLQLRHEMFEASEAPANGSLQRKPFTTEVVLSDGGVYDNLGLETVWKRYKTVLVSDAGGKLQLRKSRATTGPATRTAS